MTTFPLHVRIAMTVVVLTALGTILMALAFHRLAVAQGVEMIGYLWREALLTAALLSTGFGISWLAARRLTHPLIALQQAVDARAPLRGAITQGVFGHDEVGRLAESFSEMSENLLRSSARTQAILDSAAIGIIMIDTTGRVEIANTRAARMFGHTEAEILGQPLEALMPGHDQSWHQAYVATALPAEPVATPPAQVLRGRRQDGTLFPIEVHITRAQYSDRLHLVAVVEDVSRRLTLESQRDGLIAALERSNVELDQFAYIASHDLKAPLRVISNGARWLEEDLDDHLDADTRETLALMRNRVLRMERLLDALLEHSRIGRVGMALVMTPGADLLEDIRALAPMPAGFTFAVTGPFDTVTLPRMPLLTVLVNLVSNAVKHHDRDRGTISLDLCTQGSGFIFTLSDDGPGIPPAYHAKVFEMFQTLRPRDQVEGSGMGLALVRKHVLHAGGTITLASEDGVRGCRFTVAWPKPEAEAGTASSQGPGDRTTVTAPRPREAAE